MKYALLGLGIYFIGFFVTIGYTYNEHQKWCNTGIENGEFAYEFNYSICMRRDQSILKAAFWPIYWPSRISIEAFE